MPGWENGKRVRPEKGKCRTELPLDYVVVDIETTGLDRYCSVIEASALRVRRGEVAAEFSSLLQPPKLELYRDGEWQEGYVDKFITGLTGITDAMLETAPKPREALPRLAEFLGEDVLLGHNVHFDVNFLYDAFEEHLGLPLRNDFVDTLRISRKLLPQLPHRRLSDLAVYFGVSYEGAHRALTDCRITHGCYLQLRAMALETGTEEEFSALFERRKAREEIPVREEGPADREHPFYGKRVAFAGKLRSMARLQAKELVARAGGIPDDAVNDRTDYLVIGGAAAPMLRGGGMAILSEEGFLKLAAGSGGIEPPDKV